MTQPVIVVKIEGLAELRNALIKFPIELHAGPLRSAVTAGLKVVQRAAATLAPKKTGTLARAIYRTRSKSESSAVQEAGIVGVRYGKRFRRRGIDAWYWRFIEFGTSKMAAHPFLRPAFDTTRDEQLSAFTESLAKGIDRVRKKLSWTTSRS